MTRSAWCVPLVIKAVQKLRRTGGAHLAQACSELHQFDPSAPLPGAIPAIGSYNRPQACNQRTRDRGSSGRNTRSMLTSNTFAI